MFQIKPNPTFAAKVPIAPPGGVEVLVDFTFKHMGKSALAAWLESKAPEAEQLDKVIADWGIADGAEKVPYSAAALATFLDAYPSAALAIFKAYVRELTEARTGN